MSSILSPTGGKQRNIDQFGSWLYQLCTRTNNYGAKMPKNFNDAVQWQIATYELQTRSEKPLNAINDSHHYTEYLALPV
uniref:Uncharacterized protein n=1 Tax=Trichogramma kaykai TaxID=54128 RepID=A0ABD2XA87_9HYME